MVWHQKDVLNEDLLDPYPTLAVPSPALISSLPADIFTNRLAPSVPNSILRNPPFFFTSSFIASLTPFNNIPEI